MENSIEKKDSNISVYEKLVSVIEIDNIYVKKLTMESIIPFHDIDDIIESDKKLSIDIDNIFSLEKKLSNYKFQANGKINVSAKAEENLIFIINMELIAEYDISKYDGDISDEVYNLFVKNNVPINIWPYAREIVQSSTTRMGYPSLIIKPYRRF